MDEESFELYHATPSEQKVALMNALGRTVSILIVAAALANACGGPAQLRSAALPIVDMHLHASERPVPWAVCIPWILQVPEIDPKRTWKEAWDAVAANPPCSNPIRPVPDAREAMEQTIAVVNRRNIVGVLSGGPEQVRQWREAAPDRFVPALYLSSRRRRHYARFGAAPV